MRPMLLRVPDNRGDVGLRLSALGVTLLVLTGLLLNDVVLLNHFFVHHLIWVLDETGVVVLLRDLVDELLMMVRFAAVDCSFLINLYIHLLMMLHLCPASIIILITRFLQ